MKDLEKIAQQHPIVLFDGVCVLCNAWVDRLLRWDKTEYFRILPLQSATAQAAIEKNRLAANNSVLLFYKGKWYNESSAVLHIALLLGFPFSILGKLGLLFPSFLRNCLYRWIARNRYQWWGKKNSCRVPTAAEKKWFLTD